MSKRTINFLAGVIIIGLIVGIVGYFVSPNFQAWVLIWLGRPDGLAATATTVAALATLLAVIVGLRGIRIGRDLANAAYIQAGQAIEENRTQFFEAQYNASRPLLVPVSPNQDEQYDVEEPVTFEWTATTMFTTLQNVGTSVATNIWVALLPPAPMPDSSYQYVKRLGSPITPDGGPLKIYLQPGVSLFDENDRINEYSLCVPSDQATNANDRTDRYIARMTITYQDIFGRKHASIFDCSDRGVWVNRAFLTNIERALGEIDAAKGKMPVAVQIEA